MMTLIVLPRLIVGFTTLTLLTVLPKVVVAGWPSKMDKSDLETMNLILAGQLAIPPEEGLSCFARYKGRKGKRLAKRCAKGKRFDMHIKELQLVSLRVTNRTALEQLVNSRLIMYVEPQHKMHALPLIPNERKDEDRRQSMSASPPTESRALDHETAGRQHENEHYKEQRRRLAESVGYGITMVQADKLWDVSPPAEKTTVCVIDSGYALGHPDLPTLSNNITGTSTKGGNWDTDGYGHGSHCAGIIGALGGNGFGVAGVMKDPNQFKLHISRFLDNEGNGSEEDFLDAFRGCVDAGANIISLSVGSKVFSQTIGDACKNAYDKGILLVAAAGNDGDTSYSYPASYPEVMSVAAVGMTEKVAGFSQYNDQVEIAAPGVDIESTVPTNSGHSFGYTAWSGTSMSAPFVAGVAAALWSHFPQCTSHQLRVILVKTARRNSDAGCTDDVGSGVIQAKDAYDLLMSEGCDAGGVSPVPLSSGAFGGCFQDPSYMAPPTPSPTSFVCADNVFSLELNTDEWPDETSWVLTDSNSAVVGSGRDYRKNSLYFEQLCLPFDNYTFTIRDWEGDGMCCLYGDGGYVINFNSELVKEGGNFGEEDIVTFGNIQDTTSPSDNTARPTTPPSLPPTPSPSSAGPISPLTLKPTSMPNAHLTINPTVPVKKPTRSPTSRPTSTPTRNPTRKPTLDPTRSATPKPTLNPTLRPTALLPSTASIPNLVLTSPFSFLPTFARISKADTGSTVLSSPNNGPQPLFAEAVVLEGGERLSRGEFVSSPSGNFKVGLSSRGDLELLDKDSSLVWSAGISNADQCHLQLGGYLVVRDENGQELWSAETSRNPGARFVVNDGGFIAVMRGTTTLWLGGRKFSETVVLEGGERLSRGEFVSSPSGDFKVGLSMRGDLELLDKDSVLIWSAGISKAGQCHLQLGGYLVVRDKNGQELWSAETSRNPGARLIVDDDGYIAVMHDTTAIWLDGGGFAEAVVLESKERLSRGEFVLSPSGDFKVGLSVDGDLELLYKNFSLVWSAGLSKAEKCLMKKNGNLVILDISEKIIWETNTSGNPGARLIVSDGGYIGVRHGTTAKWLEGVPKFGR